MFSFRALTSFHALAADHHDYDDVAPDLFQLSEEDVHALGTNDRLREVLVPFENLHITEELSEGTAWP